VRRAHSTIWKVVHRHGLSRRLRGERRSYRRYEWSRPGALRHMDVKQLARFRAPGHRVGGATGATTAAPATTDNAFVYTKSGLFRSILASCGARTFVIPPYTPRWNGKVEAFINTLQQEWAYAHRWPNSSPRARALLSFHRYYNRRRPHSSLGDRPPISRVHNLCGQLT
jgi:hypothetical protein